MQLQQRYCYVQLEYQSAVTGMEVTTEADRTFVIWFLRVSCFVSALCTEQNKKLSQPLMFLQKLQQLKLC